MKYGELNTTRSKKYACWLKSYGESLAGIDLDCWTIISNLSAVTKKIRLGPVITYLFPQFRNILLLAKQALTMQDISNKKLEFRTGAGAALQWAPQWWHPYSIDYQLERVLLLEEGGENLLWLSRCLKMDKLEHLKK